MTEPGGATPQTAHSHSSKPAWYRRKSLFVFAGVIFAAGLLGASTQPWLSVTAEQTVMATKDLPVTGAKIATAVTALALVAAAAALAVGIGGRILRVISAIVMLLAGAGATAVVISTLADPAAAAKAPVGEELGVTGMQMSVTVQPMLWVSLAAAVMTVLTAATILVAGRGWTSSRRYRTSPPTSEVPETPQGNIDEFDGWDQLSRGEDPT